MPSANALASFRLCWDQSGETQVRIFEAEGLSAARAALGHSDDADDMDYLVRLVKRGCTLGMDHIFRGNSPTLR